jgi:CBS-domain-containing membrane protein
MKHSTIAQVMTTDVISVHGNETYKSIVDILHAHAITAVPVVDAQHRVVGVVSEADLLYKLEYAAPDPGHSRFARRRSRVATEKAEGVTAADLMSVPAITVSANEPLAAAARLMHARGIRRLPVVDATGELVGIVSRSDLLRVYLRDDESIRDEIRHEVLERALWMSPDACEVHVSNGVVTLSGVIDRRSSIPLVARLTQTVDGVVDVVCHLSYHFDDRHTLDEVPVPFHSHG